MKTEVEKVKMMAKEESEYLADWEDKEMYQRAFIDGYNKAKEMKKEQNEKYNELKEVIENIIEHLDEGRVLTLRKDSIIVEALRNTINQ